MAELFTNTFENGMNKDLNPVLQPKGTYTHMVDCTLITQNGNNYVVSDCIGNLLTFSINRPYDGVYNAVGAHPMPLAFISFPNRLIVLSTTNEDANTTGYLEIGELKYLPYGEGMQPYSVAGEYNAGYVPLYHSANLNGNKMYRIEGIAMPEGQQTERIYWTDNNEQPRVFNTADPRFTTYIASGSLSTDAGTQYMVVEGVVEYDGVQYGPGITAGNVFSVDGIIVAYSDISVTPSPKVIEYVDYQLLDWTPKRKLGEMTFDGYGTGSVNCGSKVYFFRYGISADGYFTPWSYPSAPVHVYTDNETAYLTAGQYYANAVGAGTRSTTVASDHSVKIRVDNIDTKFDIIQLAVAEYDNLKDVISNASIVAQESITAASTEIVLEHTGDINFSDVTVEDLTLFPASIEKVKTLDTNKNYLLIGNITEREELGIPQSIADEVTLTSFEYEMPSYPTVEDLSTYEITDISASGSLNPSNIVPESHWLVTDDSGGVVVYNGVNYSEGDTFTGLDSIDTVTIPAGSQIRPCVIKNKYTTNAAVDVKEVIQMKNDQNFWDYKDPLIHQELTGYWSTETYRYGVLFYDLKGNPYYVRHIGDFQFPTNYSKGGLTIMHEYQDAGIDNFMCLNPSGLNVSGLKIPAADINNIRGFSIVRAVRDARVVCQGVVTQCSYVVGAPDVIYPGAYVPISYDLNGAVPRVRDRAYSFMSPDLLCESELRNTVGVIGDTIEGAQWLNFVDFTGGNSYVGDITGSGSQQLVSKGIYSLTGDTAARTGEITSWFDVAERATVGTGVNDNFQNQSFTTVAPTPSGLANGAMVGGRKVYFTLDADFNHYLLGTGYTANANNAQQAKILMNYVKSNASTPYGGTGEQALANTVYISTGHYQEITPSVKTQTVDGNGDFVFDNIEIWGGDCFVNLIDYGYGLWDNNYIGAGFTPYSYAWQFPCECNTNYNLRRGRKQTNSGMYFTGDVSTKSIVYLGAASEVRPENFEYNNGYTSEGSAFQYPALPFNFINNSLFKARVRYAGPKFINEINDSFRTFLTNDYKDMDVLQGGINCIKVKDGRVFVWQDLALNTVPVLERQILSGLPGAVTTLGTGGVVDRFDPISSYNGTQHQWSVIPTEYGFAYFDMRHKAFMVIDQSLNEASFVGGMTSFFNEAFDEVGNQSSIIDQDLILNSPTFRPSSDRPLMGVGITGVYDPKFKLTYMTFKFFRQRKISSIYNDITDQNFTVVYYHPTKAFMGFSSFTPAIAHNHNYWVLASNDSKNRSKYYGVDMLPTVFAIGDTAKESNVEYICIQPVAIDQYPPTSADTAPDYVGSVYWQKVNSTDQIWVNNQPTSLGNSFAPDYIYNKIFGKAVTNVLEFIVNPRNINPFNVNNIEQEGNGVNVTSIETSSDSQSAADLSISSTNRWYRVIYDKICSALPLSTTGRITDSYLRIRMTKKNWTTDPTSVSLPKRILVQVNSFFNQKR